MLQFRFEVDGEIQLRRYLDILAENISDFTVIFEKIADDFRDTMSGVFSAEGAFEGRSRWAPLSPDYAIQKARKFPGRPILHATGKLRKSLTTESDGHICQITPTTLKIGTSDEKAIFHQRGTRKMPQREIVRLTQSQKSRWTRIIHTEVFRNTGGVR